MIERRRRSIQRRSNRPTLPNHPVRAVVARRRRAARDSYAQFARQTRLQPLGMGALAMSQPAAASIPEQSNEPAPGAGETHDGGGGGAKQPPEASEYSVPSGQTPASRGAAATHPYAGVRQIWDGEQRASPQANSPPSVNVASPAAWSELPPESKAEPLSEPDSPPDEEDAASFVPASALAVPLSEPELPQPVQTLTAAASAVTTRSVRRSVEAIPSRPQTREQPADKRRTDIMSGVEQTRGHRVLGRSAARTLGDGRASMCQPMTSGAW